MTATTETTLPIRDASDGTTWIELIKAPSRRKLAKVVRENNWRKDMGCGADCTGQIFMQSATLLRAYHVDGAWVGVVERSQARDV